MDARVDVPADPGFVRTLGAAEEGIDTLETVKARCHIVRVIAYEGVLDTEVFARALRHTLDRRVLANTRIVRPPGAVPYFARSERPPEFSVVDRVDTEHWRAEFERQMSTPVSADHVLRVCVLVGDHGGEVVLSCHHAVCDGRSLTRFCCDVVDEYGWLQRGAPGDPTAVAGAVSPPIEEILPQRLTGPERQEIMDRFIADRAAIALSPPGFVMDAGPQVGSSPANRVLTYELPPAPVEVLSGLARANGTTIGGAISAAILRAGVDIGGQQAEDELGIFSNIDLRPHLREHVPVTNMGMYATSWPGAHADIRTKSFWALAREVTEDVLSSIESLDAHCNILLAAFSLKMHVAGEIPVWPQFMLANLGRVDLPRPTESFRVRSIHGGTPSVGGGPFFFCCAVGLSGAIAIDVNYESPTIGDDVARGFGESLIERLIAESGLAAPPQA